MGISQEVSDITDATLAFGDNANIGEHRASPTLNKNDNKSCPQAGEDRREDVQGGIRN